LFLSIQDVPRINLADPLGCLYLSIQIESVFIYSYHIETHLTYSALQLTGVQKNVFLYGGLRG